MTTPSPSRADYRLRIARRWYSISGLDTLRREVIANETLDANTSEELVQTIDRRVTEIVDDRLTPRSTE